MSYNLGDFVNKPSRTRKLFDSPRRFGGMVTEQDLYRLIVTLHFGFPSISSTFGYDTRKVLLSSVSAFVLLYL